MNQADPKLIERLLNPGLIAVVRASSAEQVLPLSEALVAGGIVAIEITTSTPDYLAAIRMTKKALGDAALVGVGTVLNSGVCDGAIAAGAEFVVSPVMLTELVPLCHAAGRPVMLGAYTPTECQRVHESDADFVKLFPADTLGPGYIKSLRAPMPHLRIVPTGGVDLRNVQDFLKAGCMALGVGSSLLNPDVLKSADWPALTALARKFVAAVAESGTARPAVYLKGENRWWR